MCEESSGTLHILDIDRTAAGKYANSADVELVGRKVLIVKDVFVIQYGLCFVCHYDLFSISPAHMPSLDFVYCFSSAHSRRTGQVKQMIFPGSSDSPRSGNQGSGSSVSRLLGARPAQAALESQE